MCSKVSRDLASLGSEGLPKRFFSRFLFILLTIAVNCQKCAKGYFSFWPQKQSAPSHLISPPPAHPQYMAQSLLSKISHALVPHHAFSHSDSTISCPFLKLKTLKNILTNIYKSLLDCPRVEIQLVHNEQWVWEVLSGRVLEVEQDKHFCRVDKAQWIEGPEQIGWVSWWWSDLKVKAGGCCHSSGLVLLPLHSRCWLLEPVKKEDRNFHQGLFFENLD